MIKTKKGLDLPISGSPEQKVDQGRAARSCAVVAYDFPGLKPTMAVAEGDKVVAGQLLFTDKMSEGINRGVERYPEFCVNQAIDTCRSNFLSAFRQLNCGRLSDEDKSNYRRDCEVQVLTMVV